MAKKKEEAIPNVMASELNRFLFRKKLATDTISTNINDVEIQFHIQALSDIALSYIKHEGEDADGKPDELKLANLFIKFGLVGISNLTDEDGEPVVFESEIKTILNTPVSCATDSFVEKLSRNLKANLAGYIAEISELSTNEQLRIEFFRKGS